MISFRISSKHLSLFSVKALVDHDSYIFLTNVVNVLVFSLEYVDAFVTPCLLNDN